MWPWSSLDACTSGSRFTDNRSRSKNSPKPDGYRYTRHPEDPFSRNVPPADGSSSTERSVTSLTEASTYGPSSHPSPRTPEPEERRCDFDSSMLLMPGSDPYSALDTLKDDMWRKPLPLLPELPLLPVMSRSKSVLGSPAQKQLPTPEVTPTLCLQKDLDLPQELVFDHINATKSSLTYADAPHRSISKQKFSVAVNALRLYPYAPPYQIQFLAFSLKVHPERMSEWFLEMSDKCHIGSSKSKGRLRQESNTIAVWKRKIIEDGLSKWPNPTEDLIRFLADALAIDHGICWQFVKQDADARSQLAGRKPQEKPRLDTLSAAEAPTPEDVGRTVTGAGGSPLSEGPSLHRLPPEKTWRPVPRSILGFREDCLLGLSEPPWNTMPVTETDIDDDLSNVDSDDVDGLQDSREMTIEDELAACFGAEPARAALAALDEVIVADPSDLLRAAASFRQSASGNSSTGSPDSSSSQSKSDLSTAPTNSSSPDSNKRKNPPGDNGDEEEENDNNKQQRASKKSKASPDAQTRWDCPFNRGPKGAPKSTCGCAVSGLLLKDLWYVTPSASDTPLIKVPVRRRHLMRDHFGCGKCKLKFQTDQAVKDHFYYRFDDPTICRLNLHGSSAPDLTYEQLKKMGEEYQKKDLNNLQKTWATWWDLIWIEKYPGRAAPNGVHQGTVTFPSAVFPRIMEEVWKALNGKVDLDPQQRLEIESAVEEKARLFSRSYGVKQRRSRGPGQPGQMSSTPVPARMPALNGNAAVAMQNPPPNDGQLDFTAVDFSFDQHLTMFPDTGNRDDGFWNT